MQIKTLKDLKDVLAGIPDNVAADFGAGINSDVSDRVQIMAFSDNAEEDYQRHIEEVHNLNQNLTAIELWLKAIIETQVDADSNDETGYESEEPIHSPIVAQP